MRQQTPALLDRTSLCAATPSGHLCPGLQQPLQQHRTRPGALQSSLVHSLSFGYTPGLIQLPADATDRYFQVRNITLQQLPQAQTSQGAVAAGSGRRRLQQAAAGGSNMASLPATIPPEHLTILLWPFNRCAALCVVLEPSRAVLSCAMLCVSCVCQSLGISAGLCTDDACTQACNRLV